MSESGSSSRYSVSEQDIVGFVMDSTRERYQRLSWQGNFTEYLKRVSENPYRQTRTAYQLIRDMIHHYGIEEFEDSGETVKHYTLFDDPFDGGKNRIYGLERAIHKLVQYIEAAADEQGKERILILHGPVGTAKTSLADMLQRGLEAYTQSPEGEVYTFAWRFGRDFNVEGMGSLGFRSAAAAESEGDYAGLERPVAVLPSQLHEHPLLLIPREERRLLLERMFKQAGIADKYVPPHKLLEAELDFNSKQIYNFLIRVYEGNWMKVMDHVLVQRVHFSESAGFGLAKVPPEGNVETTSQPVTMDENFRFIANLINSITLLKYYGKYVLGNRGIVHYSDIFKKRPEHLQHLLAAVEEHRMDFGQVGSHIDTAILGTTNISEFFELRKNPISVALRSRIRKIDIPYLCNYRDEEKIYRRGLRQLKNRPPIAPHTTEMAARWAVMTRLEPTKLHESEEIDDEDTKRVLSELTPSSKALIYAGRFPPEMKRQQRQKITARIRRLLVNEHKYEGMNGVPTRTLQDLFADLCEDRDVECITPFKVFDLLEEIVKQGPENLDFLAREAEGDWYDFEGFIEVVRVQYDRMLKHEVENSIIDIDVKEMEERMRSYLKHVSAFNKKEKITSRINGQEEAPDENLMRMVEDPLGVTDEERENYRFRVLSRATKAAAKGAIDIFDVYQDEFQALQKTLYNQRRKTINWSDIDELLTRSRTHSEFEQAMASESTDKFKHAVTLIRNLEGSYGYEYPCARVAVLYYIGSLLEE